MIRGPEDSHLADPRPESSFPTRGRMAAASRLICARSFWAAALGLADIVSLDGGRDWSQIEEALKSKALEHFVLLVTPEALEIDASQSGEGSARS
jgi:hypothetical protein